MGEPDRAVEAPTAYKGTRIEHRAAIAAPAGAIWRLLRDVDGWSRWNPLYGAASGAIDVSDTLDLAIVLPGMKPQKARATVIASVPDQRLHYRSSALAGLSLGLRYVEIEETGPASCIVTNGEIMGGLLGPLLARILGERIRQGLQAMAGALKQVTEAK